MPHALLFLLAPLRRCWIYSFLTDPKSSELITDPPIILVRLLAAYSPLCLLCSINMLPLSPNSPGISLQQARVHSHPPCFLIHPQYAKNLSKCTHSATDFRSVAESSLSGTNTASSSWIPKNSTPILFPQPPTTPNAF